MFPSEYKKNAFTIIAEKHLGYSGMMLSGSKSGYRKVYPSHVPIFNANVCTKEDGKIWHGDLDLTLDSDKLIKLSSELKKTVYVLYEMDGRFGNADKPLLEQAVFLASDFCMVTDRLDKYTQICKSGKLKGKTVYKPEYRR